MFVLVSRAAASHRTTRSHNHHADVQISVSLPRCQSQEPVCSIVAIRHLHAVTSSHPAQLTSCVSPAEMRHHPFISSVTALVVGAVSVHASSLRDSSELRTRQFAFRSQIQNDTNLRYVENSGICETTPGVTQYSGYIDVGKNMSMVSTIW